MIRIPKKRGMLTPAHTGCYWRTTTAGQGFYLYVQEKKGVVYWYTFHQKRPAWYFGYFDLEDEIFPLMTTSGGTFIEPHKHSVETIGAAQVGLWNDHVIFNYHCQPHGRGAIECTDWSRSADPVSGVYADPTRIGSGLALQCLENQDGPVLAGGWFTYGADKKQRWYACHGALDEGGPGYALKVYEPIGGRFRYSRPAMVEIGTAVLDMETMQLDYMLPLERNIPDGHLNLDRVF